MSTDDLDQFCPMCGEPVLLDAESCAACGERLNDKRLNDSELLLLKKFQSQMNGLAGVWYALGGVITAAMSCVWILAILDGKLPGFDLLFVNDYLGSFIDALITLCGVLSLILAAACRRRTDWSVYASLIVSYTALGCNLVLFQACFNVCGVGIVIPVVILSHLSVKTARQLRQAGVPLDYKP